MNYLSWFCTKKGNELLADFVTDLSYLLEVKKDVYTYLTRNDARLELEDTCLSLLNSTLPPLSVIAEIIAKHPDPQLEGLLKGILADLELAQNSIPGFINEVHCFTASQSNSQVEAQVEAAGRNLERITPILARLLSSYQQIVPLAQQKAPPDEESSSNFPQELDLEENFPQELDLEENFPQELDLEEGSASNFPQELDLEVEEGSASNFPQEPNLGSPQPTTEIVRFKETQGEIVRFKETQWPHIPSPFEESGGPELLELYSGILQNLLESPVLF